MPVHPSRPPAVNPERRARPLARTSTLARALRVTGAFALAQPFVVPVLARLGSARAAVVMSYPWPFLCHRIAERTLTFDGAPMPMCSRCAGIAMGVGAGLLVGWPYLAPRRLWSWIAAASAILLLEMGTQDHGLHPIWHATRLATGALLAYPIGAAFTGLARKVGGERRSG